MTSNFDFLKTDFPKLYDYAIQAESLVYSAPRASCFYSRYTLEQAVLWLYENDPYLQLPYDTKLGALIHEQTFQDNLSPGIFQKIRLIQKVGNIAVHQQKTIGDRDALHIIEELFHFLYWVCRYYSSNGKNLGEITFNPALLQQPETSGTKEKTLAELQQLEAKLSQSEAMKRIAEERQQRTEAELASLKAQLDALLAANKAVPDRHNWNEANTRKYLIDVLLQEMGWNLSDPNCREYPVEGMPLSVNPSGKGKIDYVLWDDNGLPLAIIEAKRTTKDPKIGQQQAKLYADCLEQKFNQRPIIFYSNGYHTYIWDDQNYPPREIHGFLRKDELQRLIWRRTNQKALHLVQVNQDIAGVEAYIRANENHVAIAKLRRNLPLTDTDLNALEVILFTTEGLENKERFTEVFKTQATNLKSFIRSLVGLDRAAAKTAFSQYLENTQFTANQIRFIEQIIDLLTQQGVMDPKLLYEPPFTELHHAGIDGLFGDDDADNIVAIIRSFNDSVDMNFGIA